MPTIRLSFELPAGNGFGVSDYANLFAEWFPEIQWGSPKELLKHSNEWPEGCVDFFEFDGDFPGKLSLLVFPVDSGNVAAMAVAKIHLMRRLSAHLGQAVRSRGVGFGRADDCGDDAKERLMCHDGQFFFKDEIFIPFEDPFVCDWRPLNNVPVAAMNKCGKIINKRATCTAFRKWRKTHAASLDKMEKAKCDEFHPPTDFGDADDEIEWSEPLVELPPVTNPIFRTPEELEASKAELFSYLQKLDAWEDGYGTTSAKQLIARGVSLPDPDSLDDPEASAKLTEVIDYLAMLGTYLDSTDHMTDRQLYTRLWKETLNHITMDISDQVEGACVCMIDFTDGNEDDQMARLRHSASIRERADWKADFPDSPVPAHEPKKPADRDRFLPKPEMM